MRQLFVQLADETTWHGIKQLYEAKGARKVTWAVALLMAVALTVMLFSTTIQDYFHYKTYISTRLEVWRKFDFENLGGKVRPKSPRGTLLTINFGVK